MSEVPLLEVRDLVVPLHGRRLRRGPGRALDGVSLRIGRGETYGVAGESGSGASALGRAVAGLVPPASGQVLVDGTDIAPLDGEALRALRHRVRLLTVAADPAGRRSVAALLTGARRASGLPTTDDTWLGELADDVELPAAALTRPPQELSAAHRRRVDVARALCTDPELVVADEPVAGLDVTEAAQLVDLLARLRSRRGLTLLLIARDLGVVRHLSDQVGVLHLGAIVEEAQARALYRGPRHPYTRALLSAVPVPDPEVEDRRERLLLTGDPLAVPAPGGGCAFRSRCPWSRPGRCVDERPWLRVPDDGAPGHLVACHHAEQLGE